MNGVSRSYLRDGAYVTDPLLHDGEAAYTPGASVREYGATKYLHSGLKNADAQSGSAQTLTATRLYDAFGNVDSSSGSWTGALGYGGPYGYQSASEGGLMLLGHRYYDPSTGRFLTRDPISEMFESSGVRPRQKPKGVRVPKHVPGMFGASVIAGREEYL